MNSTARLLTQQPQGYQPLSLTEPAESTSQADRKLFIYSILLAFYASALTIAGPHGAKLAQLGPFTFDAGLLTYSVCFLVTDIVSEVYGKKFSRQIIISSFFGLLVAFCMTKVALLLPASSDWSSAEGYSFVFGTGNRIFLAVLIAYVASQLTDIYVFSLVKKLTNGRHLWLRNNLSTMAGGLLDAILFSTIAFYGTYPVIPIITSAYIIRIALSVVDTPLVYLAVYFLKGKELS